MNKTLTLRILRKQGDEKREKGAAIETSLWQK
jgi:hypothetical protein